MHILTRALSALALTAATLHAAVVDVFPTTADALQVAIDAANSGDILRIHGGAYGPITIDKPLELIANPGAVVQGLGLLPQMPPPLLVMTRPITLAGPGSGRVVLQNISVAGSYDVTQFSAVPTAHMLADGFDELRLINCSIQGPFWIANGGIGGAPGITSSIPLMILSGTSVRPLSPVADFGSGPGVPPPAIDAPNSTIIAGDCDIMGGSYGVIDIGTGNCNPQSYSTTLVGGTGVRCERFFQTGGSVRGGAGTVLDCGGPVVPLIVPDGIPVIAREHIVQPETLVQVTRPRVGQSWDLLSRNGPNGGLLRIAFAYGGIEFHPTGGYNVVETPQVFQYVTVAPTVQDLSFPVPNDASLIGFDLVAETYDTAYGVFGGAVITQIR